MKILAFDTSGKATAIVLAEAGINGENLQFLAEKNFVDELNHSVSLMPTIDELMKSINWQPADLTRIAVAVGPGSYTGLRIAVTAAKTLAFTLSCELVGVSSLAVLAAPHEGKVVALMNARRGFVYAGAYENGKNILPDQHLELTKLLSALPDWNNLTFVGETSAFESEIQSAFPAAKIIEQTPQGRDLVALGAAAAPVKDVHNFNPNYLKKVEAEEKWEAKNGPVESPDQLVSRV